MAVVGMDGKPLQPKPKPRWYEIVITNPEQDFIQMEGFLVVTPGFIGISGPDERIKCIVPIENVLYVQELDDGTEEDEDYEEEVEDLEDYEQEEVLN